MRRSASALVLLFALCSLGPGSARAQGDPVFDFIVAADSVRAAGGVDALEGWLGTQPDLTGAAVARLLDIAAQVGDAGNTEGEAENLVLVEALAEAHARIDPDSAMDGLLEEYRSWDAADRAARADARAREDAAWQLSDSAPDSALAELVAVDSVYAAIGDSPSRARVYGRIGATEWYRQNAEGTREAYLEALSRRRAVQDRVLEAATLNGLGSVEFRMFGDLAVAADWYRQAIDLRRALGDRAGLGTSLTYAANVEVRLGHLLRARELYEEARPLLARDVAVVENMSGTAGLYQEMGRPGDAIALYEQAIALCDSAEDCPHTPFLLVALAEVQRSVGQLREARRTLDRAEDLYARQPDTDGETRLWQTRAMVAIALGEQDTARDATIRALQLTRESGNGTLQSEVSSLLSGLYLDLGAPDRAQSAAEDALRIARELGDENLERDALCKLGDVALRQERSSDAIGFFDAALEIDERFGIFDRQAQDLIGRGGAHSDSGDLERARDDLRRASGLLARAGTSTGRWIALLNLADSFEQTEPDSAAWYYDQALDALEAESDASGGQALNTGYLFADRGRAYEEIARYYADRDAAEPGTGWDARAFATAERSRARGLLELLDASFALDAGPEALALIDSLYALDDSAPGAGAARARITERLATLRAERRDAALGRDPATLDELRGQLDDETLLLQYAVGDSASLLWVVGSDGSELMQLPGRAELRQRVTSFRDALAQPGAGDTVVLREGRALYSILLAPAAARITTHRDLVLVPDDVLFELPFEALLEGDPPAGARWSEQPFFGRTHAPVVTPSSTVYLALRERDDAHYERELVALGGADYSGLDRALDPLPFTEREVQRISAGLDATDKVVLLGADATEPRLKQALEGPSTRVVHLATHGLVDPAEPARSCVALGAGGDQDGYLYSLEILALHLDRPMIVLSACESALGRLERGEGVVGLTRSFLAAGARGVVASLWPVPDASTAALMGTFYDELWQHHSAAQAMHTARAELLASEEWSHPYFWSAFVLVGTERMPW